MNLKRMVIKIVISVIIVMRGLYLGGAEMGDLSSGKLLEQGSIGNEMGLYSEIVYWKTWLREQRER